MAVTKISKQLNKEKLIDKIVRTSQAGWKQRINRASVENWLGNFSGEVLHNVADEHALAAWLLLNFTYYTEEEEYELCRNLFRKYIHIKLLELNKGQCTDDDIRKIIKETVFIGLGNPSESGTHILYELRIANKLPKAVFKDSNLKKDLEEGRKRNIVLVDDVTLSGNQATTYISDNFDTQESSGVFWYLMTFFATPKAIDRLQKEQCGLTLISTMILDDSAKLFSETSKVFCNPESAFLREPAYDFCMHYGKKAISKLPADSYMENCPLGYADGQYLFAFSYNTPNNTLPIFWVNEKGWVPIFRRQHKVYSMKGMDISHEYYW